MSITRRTALLAPAFAAIVPRRVWAEGTEETIKIGISAPLTGPNAENGRFQLNGANLAIETLNSTGGALGKPVELVAEDDQNTNPGAVLAFSRLAARQDIVAFIGPASSTQMHAITPDVLRTGKPMAFFGSDPTLTRQGNPWLFRCRVPDSYSARLIADYGVKELKKQKWAIVYSTDSFGTSAVKLLVDALGTFAIKPRLVLGYANQQVDFTATALAIKQSDADVIGSYFTFPADLALFARQLRQLGVTTTWVGSQVNAQVTSRKLAGAALFGTYSVIDFSIDANPEARAFADRYEQTYRIPPDSYSAQPFDAVTILAHAINAAGDTDPKKIREAILAIHGLKGVNGTFSFDASGEGLRGLNIVRNDNGRIAFIRHIEFAD